MLSRLFSVKVLRLTGNSLKLPMPQYTTNLDFALNQTLEEVSNKLKEVGVRNVEITGVDGVRFSHKTQLSDLKRSAFVVTADKHSFKILPENDLNPLELSPDFLETCGLPLGEVRILSQHMQRLSMSLQVLDRQEFSKEEIHKAINSNLPAGTPPSEKPEQLRERLSHLEEELRGFARLEAYCQRKAVKAARRTLWLGLGVLGLQWGYIAAGTFVYFSWDVMEPQAYLIGLGNLIIGVSYYLSRRNEFALQSVFAVLKQKKFLKYSKKYNLNLPKLEQLRTEVERVRKMIYRTN